MPSYKQSEPKQGGAFFVPPGIYEVEIVKATEKTSQNGNPMIALVGAIKMPNGNDGPQVWDNLVFTAKAAWKIDQFLASTGSAVVPGEDVEIEADDCVGKVGVAVIGEEPGSQNPQQKFNCIERWIFGDERSEFLRAKRASAFNAKQQGAAKEAAAKDGSAKKDDSEDDIPF